MLATSFVVYALQLPIMPAEKGIDPAMTAWLAASLQAIIDGPSPSRT